MVAFVAAFGFCYGCGAVAVCTRRLNVQRERIVEQIGFIFGTGAAGSKWSGLGAGMRRGGRHRRWRPSWWGCFGLEFPTAAHVGACTAEGVLLKIITFPNY